jgi:hypothetical protein
MGLSGVVSTQLWHHLFIDSSLADLPSQAASWKNGAAQRVPARLRIGQAASP